MKKGRNKVVYGVNNAKFYAESSDKNAVERLKMAAKEDTFEEREKIFEENRPALMKLIRYLEKV